MKKIITAAAIALTIIAIFYSGRLQSNQNGAPTGTTSAPGDAYGSYSCTYPGCHAGNPLNVSPGYVQIFMLDQNNNNVASYVPGQKYKIHVSLIRSGMSVG